MGLTREKKLEQNIQALLDKYVNISNHIPNVKIIGYHVEVEKGEKVKG